MSEWKTYRLGEICKNVCSGGTPKSTEPSYYGGNIPWLNTKEVNFCRIDKTEKTITDSGFQNSSTKWVEKNSVIVAMYGATAAKVAVNMIPLTTNQACCNLTIDPNLADFRFVYFYLCYKYTSLAALANGGAQQNLNAQRIKDFDITLPPLEEQKHIADILWSLDDKIELNRRINANLEAQAQALFRSWFVDFEPFRDGPFVDSELGKIPQGWKVGTLSEVADITMGQSPKGSSYNEEGDGIIFYQGRAEFGNRFPSIRLYTTEPTRIAEINSVLLSVRAPVGDINIAKNKCCIGRGLAAIKSKQGYNSFILYLLQSLKPLLEQYNGEGTVFGCINRKEIEGLPIIIPKESVINEFERIAENIDSEIKSLTTEQETLSALRDTLLPKLMAGEIAIE